MRDHFLLVQVLGLAFLCRHEEHLGRDYALLSVLPLVVSPFSSCSLQSVSMSSNALLRMLAQSDSQCLLTSSSAFSLIASIFCASSCPNLCATAASISSSGICV